MTHPAAPVFEDLLIWSLFCVFFFFFAFTVGCQHGAVHQCQPVRAVCAHPDGASPEESLPAGPQLHRGATPDGGREREAGESAHRYTPH